MDYLVFQLAGIQGSWGGIACGEQRQSYRHPTKSAILGLIAAGLGIERSDSRLNELTNSIQVAVQEIRCEHNMNDFQTIQTLSELDLKKLKKKKCALTRKNELNTLDLNTILSNREYWMDVYYRIAITTNSDIEGFSLKNIQSALENPNFHLYLGRKSCPICLPLCPTILSANNLIDLFEKVVTAIPLPSFVSQKMYSKSQTYLNSDGSIFCDSGLINGDEPHKSSIKRDVPADRNLWTFCERKEVELLRRVN